MRCVIYDAASSMVKIDLIKQPDGSARDEAASTASYATAPKHTFARPTR
jgi:hypothetical protein